jgi:hypothetical protein
MLVQVAAAGAAIRISSKVAFVIAGLLKYRRVLRWLARIALMIGLERYAVRVLKFTLRHPFRVASLLGTIYGCWRYRKIISVACTVITAAVVTEASKVWGYVTGASGKVIEGLDGLGGWLIKQFAMLI